jgi:hypothetical protein
MEKPKTYMLRLYPDKASDQILINYLKKQRNIQQYIKQLIENDIEKKNIVLTIREIMEEYLQQTQKQQDREDSIQVTTEKDTISDTFGTKDTEKATKEKYPFTDYSDDVEIQEEQSDDVEQITPEAMEFLAGLGQ